MIVYPAVDLRGGRAVQLEGGRPELEKVTLEDPCAVARRWIGHGFTALHVVDLDAALGIGENRQLLTDVIHAVPVPVQAGGGIRDGASVRRLLDAGASRVIVGTRAVLEPDWARRIAHEHPRQIVVAADVKEELVLTRGWTAESGVSVEQFLRQLESLPLAAILVTDVGREGRMQGIDETRFAALAAIAPHPLIAAGGIATLDDLRRLDRAGAAGAVIGMALYTGAIDPVRAAQEFSA